MYKQDYLWNRIQIKYVMYKVCYVNTLSYFLSIKTEECLPDGVDVSIEEMNVHFCSKGRNIW